LLLLLLHHPLGINIISTILLSWLLSTNTALQHFPMTADPLGLCC